MNPEVILRPFTRAEYHEFYQRYKPDPLMDPRPYRYQYTHVDCSYNYDETRRDWYPVFGIFANGVAVGTLSLKRIDRDKSRCEIGLTMVNDSCKGLGYGTAAMREAIRMAREDYGLRNLYADTMGNNLRMQHILEKLGFRLIERISYVYNMGENTEDMLNYLLEEPE